MNVGYNDIRLAAEIRDRALGVDVPRDHSPKVTEAYHGLWVRIPEDGIPSATEAGEIPGEAECRLFEGSGPGGRLVAKTDSGGVPISILVRNYGAGVGPRDEHEYQFLLAKRYWGGYAIEWPECCCDSESDSSSESSSSSSSDSSSESSSESSDDSSSESSQSESGPSEPIPEGICCYQWTTTSVAPGVIGWAAGPLTQLGFQPNGLSPCFCEDAGGSPLGASIDGIFGVDGGTGPLIPDPTAYGDILTVCVDCDFNLISATIESL